MSKQAQKTRSTREGTESVSTDTGSETRERLEEAVDEACCVLDAIDEALAENDDAIDDPKKSVPKYDDYGYDRQDEFNVAMQAWADKYDQQVRECCGVLHPDDDEYDDIAFGYSSL